MADVYRIGISIAMRNGVSSALKVIQKDVLGLGTAVDFTQGKLNKLKLAVGGAALAFAGKQVLSAYAGLANAGGKVLNQQAQILSLTGSQRDVVMATKEAYKDIAISNTTIAGNLSAFQALRAVLSNSKEAIAAMAPFLNAAVVFKGFGGTQAGLAYAVKALDIQGAFVGANGQLDPTRVKSALHDYNTVFGLSHGLLTPQQLLQFTKMAGPAAAMMSTSAYLRDNYELMLGLGPTGGRGEAYAIKDLLGGGTSKALAEQLAHLGLVRRGGIEDEFGHYVIKRGALSGNAQLTGQGIIPWFYGTVVPLLKAHHYALNAAGLAQALGSLPQTTLRAFTYLLTNRAQIEAGMHKYDVATQQNYLATMLASNFALAKGNVTSAFTALWQALGTPAAKMAIPILNELAGGIRRFTQWIGAHPGYAVAIDKTLLALGVGLTALGSALVIGAVIAAVGTGGTLAALGVGIAAVATVLAATNWGAISKAFGNAVSGFEHGIQRILYDITHPGQLIKDVSGLGSGAPAVPSHPPGNGHWQIAGRTRIWVPAGSHAPTGPGLIQGTEDIWHSLANWVDQGAPVTVTNPGDIGFNMHKTMVRSLAAPQTGPSGFNGRAVPYGTPAVSTVP